MAEVMSVNNLRDDLLYLFTFGPGTGESVLIRIPPDKWVVVDGCKDGKLVPAAETLRTNDASWSCVVFSHPHKDHAEGLEAVLSLPGNGPVGCVRPILSNLDALQKSSDPHEHLSYGVVEQLLSKIDDMWEADPTKQWNVKQSDQQFIGDAVLTALHPDIATIESSPRDPNALSTPILIEWREVKLLLGADLPSREWDALGQHFKGLEVHGGLKIPHHGSSGSVSVTFCGEGGDRGRYWVLTPFSPQRLPRFGDAEGLALLLRHVDKVHMTALPQQRNLQGVVPYEATRIDLRDGLAPTPITTSLGTGVSATPFSSPSEMLRCYVIAGFNATGELQDLRYGPGSVTVNG